jgi:hypothetical protein
MRNSKLHDNTAFRRVQRNSTKQASCPPAIQGQTKNLLRKHFVRTQDVRRVDMLAARPTFNGEQRVTLIQ